MLALLTGHYRIRGRDFFRTLSNQRLRFAFRPQGGPGSQHDREHALRAALDVRSHSSGRLTMARDGQRTATNSFAWAVPLGAGNPLLAVVTDINRKLLESAALVHKDWAEFVYRRVKEDIAVSDRLMNCQSLGDMQQIYSQYLQTAFEQYREQSERTVQRGNSMTEAVGQSMEPRARETMEPARH